jgi:hypothetical protein
VRERLEQAPRYWLVTNRRDGPARARAWSAFPDDVTRFRFG